MNEGELRKRPGSTAPRLTADEIANRSFPSAFRGLSESEVRGFLRQVAAELGASRVREQELLSAVDALEERLRAPAQLDEQQLLDALGEETARLLRSAREAAEDIRRKAEERAARTVKEAQDDARRMREDAERLLATRTQEADSTAAELLRDAEERGAEIRAGSERYAEEQKLRVDRESEALLDDARTTGREMIEEAKALRERVLADLARRRGLLQAQLEELRSGRDRLLEAYRVVKRTFLEATEALAQAEARVQAGASAAPVTPEELALLEGEAGADAAAAGEAGRARDQIEAPPSEEPVAAPSVPPALEPPKVDQPEAAQPPGEEAEQPEAEPPPPGEEAEQPEAEPPPPPPGEEAEQPEAEPPPPGEEAAEERPSRELPDVDSLFARLRREREVVVEDAPGPDALEGSGEPFPEPGAAAGETDAAPPAEPSPAPPKPARASKGRAARGSRPVGVAGWLAARDAAIAPLLAPVTKRAKRTAQDEQNEVLDAVRRVKGRPSSEVVLAAPEEQLARWGRVMGEALAAAYAAGRSAAGGEAVPEPLPEPAVVELTGLVVLPLRERVAVAIDDVADVGGETQALVVERIGARYREWKSQSLADLLGDALAVAFARGVYDAVPDGTVLQWIPNAEGRCPDCDDNALEPTPKGAEFPTGQALPPAHPGCRCLAAPGDSVGSESGARAAAPA